MSTLSETQKQKLVKLLLNRPNQEPEEAMEDIVLQIMPAIDNLIDICGGDSSSSGQEETSYRVVKAWLEQTIGYTENPNEHLDVQFDLEEEDTYIKKEHDDFVMVGPIDLRSVCEHHILPFFGQVYIAYIPSNKVVGISKLARLVDGYGKRMQIQEKVTYQIADAVMEVAQAKGVAVYIQAAHTCMTNRGIEQSFDSRTTTIATRGLFRNNQGLEDRFLQAVKK